MALSLVDWTIHFLAAAVAEEGAVAEEAATENEQAAVCGIGSAAETEMNVEHS